MADKLDEMINVAADWWGNIITHANFDADADSVPLSITEILATDLAMMSAPKKEMADIFKENLALVMKKHPDLEKYKFLTVSVDYHPNEILAEAAKISNIDEDVFPWKTAMKIDFRNEKIEVFQTMKRTSKIIYPVQPA